MNEKDVGLLFPKKEMKEKNPEKTMVNGGKQGGKK